MLYLASMSTRLAQVTDKAFRIMLSIVLIWPQMVGAMQDSQDGDSAHRSGSFSSPLLPSLDVATLSNPPLGTKEATVSPHISDMTDERANPSASAAAKGDHPKPLAANSDKFSSPQPKTLERIEALRVTSELRWVSLDSLLQRSGYSIVFLVDNKCCSSPTFTHPKWSYGTSFPIASEKTRKGVLAIDGFRQGVESVIFTTIHAGITVLAFYQLIEAFKVLHDTSLPCNNPLPSFSSKFEWLEFLFNTWENREHNVLLGFFHDVLGNHDVLNTLEYFALITPLFLGLVMGGLNTRQSSLLNGEINKILSKLKPTTRDSTSQLPPSARGRVGEDSPLLAVNNSDQAVQRDVGEGSEGITSKFKQLLKYLEERITRVFRAMDGLESRGVYGDGVRWIIAHPIDRNLGPLIKNALWNPNVSLEDLTEIQNYLGSLVRERRMYTSVSALGYVMQLASGFHTNDATKFNSNRVDNRNSINEESGGEHEYREVGGAREVSSSDDERENASNERLQRKRVASFELRVRKLLEMLDEWKGINPEEYGSFISSLDLDPASTIDPQTLGDNLKAFMSSTEGGKPAIQESPRDVEEVLEIFIKGRDVSVFNPLVLYKSQHASMKNRRALKEWAFKLIREMAIDEYEKSLAELPDTEPIDDLERLGTFKKYLRKAKRDIKARYAVGMKHFYAQYLMWSLGKPHSWKEGGAIALFKVSKLYAQGNLAYMMYKAFKEAERCPQQPGVSVAGIESWAKDLTQQCFEATVQAFGLIPGQPTGNLVGDLARYHFSSCTIDLDLSGKDLSWQSIFNITKALHDRNVIIREANFSNNLLTSVNEILPLLRGTTILDLSSKMFGYIPIQHEDTD